MIAFGNRADVIRHKFSLKLLLTDGTRHITAVHLLVIPNCVVEVNHQELDTGQGKKECCGEPARSLASKSDAQIIWAQPSSIWTEIQILPGAFCPSQRRR
jgi:hypothetical protein